MASSSSTNPAYNVPAFNDRDRLVALHQEITDFLHYQSHVRFAATKSLPPHTTTANQRERETIIEFLKEERARIRTLKRLLDATSGTPDVLRGLARRPRHQLGRAQLGPNAAMGTTAAATTGMTLRLPNLRPAVIAPSDTTREPTKAITTTTKHQTSRTYTVTRSTITLIRYSFRCTNLKRS